MTLTENDYAELRLCSLETLQTNLKEQTEKLYQIIESYASSNQSEREELIKQYMEIEEWIQAYKIIIEQRTIISTPPVCNGCKEGYLNQQGHFGGCIPDPYTLE